MATSLADFYDAELRRYQAHFRTAIAVARDARVLDVGCGAGETTREVARRAVDGHAVGIDISGDLLQAARARTRAEGPGNVAFECGDAQVHPFADASFDLCISRFGTMFFAEPAIAFANLARALRPGAAFVQLVWQDRDRNPWSSELQHALGQDGADTGGAFSLADRAVATDLLRDAGFDRIAFADVHAPVFYGATVDAAFDAVATLFDRRQALVGTQPDAAQARQRVRDLLTRRLTADGVQFDARAWLVTARRA